MTDKEVAAFKHRLWRVANPEKHRAAVIRWQKANPEKMAVIRRRYYLKRKARLAAAHA